MAREFLQRGDAVVLCGRSQERLRAAVDALRDEWPGTEVCAQPLPSFTTPGDLPAFFL